MPNKTIDMVVIMSPACTHIPFEYRIENKKLVTGAIIIVSGAIVISSLLHLFDPHDKTISLDAMGVYLKNTRATLSSEKVHE